MSDSATPWTVTYQAPLTMGFSRQEYWSGLPFPSPGESFQPRDWTQVSCIVGRCFAIWATREAQLKEINPEYSLKGLMPKQAPILWPPDAERRLIGKDLDTGKDWGQENKGVTEDEIVWWHHWLNGHDFEQIPGDSEEQGILACCSSWGQESQMTEQLNNICHRKKYFAYLISMLFLSLFLFQLRFSVFGKLFKIKV